MFLSHAEAATGLGRGILAAPRKKCRLALQSSLSRDPDRARRGQRRTLWGGGGDATSSGGGTWWRGRTWGGGGKKPPPLTSPRRPDTDAIFLHHHCLPIAT